MFDTETAYEPTNDTVQEPAPSPSLSTENATETANAVTPTNYNADGVSQDPATTTDAFGHYGDNNNINARTEAPPKLTIKSPVNGASYPLRDPPATAVALEGTPGETVEVNVVVRDGNGKIINNIGLWEPMDEKGQGSAAFPSASYPAAGTYTCHFWAKNSLGPSPIQFVQFTLIDESSKPAKPDLGF
jgi:hypothetical protein